MSPRTTAASAHRSLGCGFEVLFPEPDPDEEKNFGDSVKTAEDEEMIKVKVCVLAPPSHEKDVRSLRGEALSKKSVKLVRCEKATCASFPGAFTAAPKSAEKSPCIQTVATDTSVSPAGKSEATPASSSTDTPLPKEVVTEDVVTRRFGRQISRGRRHRQIRPLSWPL